MPSSTNNANNSLTRNSSFPFRSALGTPKTVGGYRTEGPNNEDTRSNEESLKGVPSAFSRGVRPAFLQSGQSDDSDLPRLSPIRTSSEPALDKWERKHKVVSQNGRGLRSCGYEGLGSKSKAVLFGRDSCELGSHEDSLTATSGAYSALSEDVWQNSPASEHTTKVILEECEGEHQRTRSHFSAFFDNFTTTISRGLQTLGISMERASPAVRELTSEMRSSNEAKPDAAIFEASPQNEKDVNSSPADSAVSTRIQTGQDPLLPALSYDTAFTLCGGQDLYEELESLCNEHAKKLNKLRTRLSEDDKRRLDSLVTRLYPIFDIVGSPSESEEEGSDRAVDERLAFLTVPLDFYVGQCLTAAAQKERCSILEIANIVANPVNVLGSASQIPLTPQTSRCAELYVELESAVQHGRHSVELIHEDGIQRIAEFSMRCVRCLSKLVNERILPSSNHTSEEWPSNREEMGWLLRSAVIRLVHGLEAVTGSFVGAMLGLGSAYDENLQDGGVGQKAQGLACDLELDSGSAVMKIQQSLRNLMYVVVYVTFDASTSR